MGIDKLIKPVIYFFIRKGMAQMNALEESLLENENSIKPNSLSQNIVWMDPTRKDCFGKVPLDLKLRSRTSPITKSMGEGKKNAIMSLVKNPVEPKVYADKKFMNNFENLAKSLGVGAIGYTKLPKLFMFRKRAVMFDNVIVMGMEMPKDIIDTVPSEDGAVMFLRIYDTLGIQIAKLVDFLRDHGYGAQTGHPMSSSSLYVPLAQRAGLGWCGKAGILINPDFGSRMRLGVLYTSINNLPIRDHNEHAWVDEFCMKCNRCVRECPAAAIHDKPIVRESGIITHIDNSKCLPVFIEEHACGICIKVCPFSYKSYEIIEESFLKKNADLSL
jgi:ferredoxin